jgi:GrpB-like predicted nucleotidyltransferase (UPF0157 family)
LLAVNSIQNLVAYEAKFLEIGYEAKSEFGITDRRIYQKDGEKRTHHVHAYVQGNPEIERHIRFRDHLIRNPHKALEYETLKIRLSK